MSFSSRTEDKAGVGRQILRFAALPHPVLLAAMTNILLQVLMRESQAEPSALSVCN